MRKRYYTLCFLLFSLFDLYALSDTLTIGQAFDWQVGDTLIYSPYTFTENNNEAPVYTHQNPIGFTVISRTNYADSIYYQLKYFSPDTSASLLINMLDSPVIYFQSNNFLLGAIANSLQDILPCDSSPSCSNQVYIDSSFDNRLFSTYTYTSDEYEDGVSSEGSVMYSEKLGILGIGNSTIFYNEEYPYQPVYGSGSGAELIYYSSSSFVWNSIATLNTNGMVFNIYPIPAKDYVLITTNETIAGRVVQLFDITGRECMSSRLQSSKTKLEIGNLPAGLYLVKMSDSQGHSETKKLVIE